MDARLAAFLDDRLEWRCLFSETWGTFLLVLVAAGAPVVGALPAGGGLSLSAKVVAPGVMVMALIYFMGTVSGAHLNPAVTWAFALRGDFPWKRVPGYVLAQAALAPGRGTSAPTRRSPSAATSASSPSGAHRSRAPR